MMAYNYIQEGVRIFPLIFLAALQVNTHTF